MRLIFAVVLPMAVACRGGDAQTERIARAEAAMGAQEGATSNLEAKARVLGSEWSDVRAGYETAAARYKVATVGLQEASATYSTASQAYLSASVVAAHAERRWKLFQKLVIVAATIDAANLQASKARGASEASSVSCDNDMSTAAYRTLLAAQGVALDGMDVDHIVPRSLGGADNPANYHLLPASVNRSLGNTWNEEKCLAVGDDRCASAVAVSRKCGSFRSLGF